jgi:hypothetical protein
MTIQNTMSRYFGASHKIVISRRCLAKIAVISEKNGGRNARQGRQPTPPAMRSSCMMSPPFASGSTYPFTEFFDRILFPPQHIMQTNFLLPVSG